MQDRRHVAYLGISPLPTGSGITWLPGDPRGGLSAEAAGCKPGASRLRLLGMAAGPRSGWGSLAVWPAPRRVWEEEPVEDPMLRDLCTLKREGISANMASMESALSQVPAELTECSQGSSNGVYGICPALSSKVAGAPLMLATQLRCPAHHAETLYLSQLILRKSLQVKTRNSLCTGSSCGHC
ncbi:hypothetical protein ABBQ32_007206 [Trebouxia sp. C0010 RCD-2024]